ncbi:MAG: cell division protein ZapA [Rikenellaceae bacterium]
MAIDNKLSINVRVGDRTYPMTIERDEEQKIRSAAKEVTVMYQRYAPKIADPYDRISLVAFQMAMKSGDARVSADVNKALKLIENINSDIDDALKE